MTKQQAIQDFKADILPDVIERYGADDIPAKCEAWNDWTDSLCKDGYITLKQYETWGNPF